MAMVSISFSFLLFLLSFIMSDCIFFNILEILYIGLGNLNDIKTSEESVDDSGSGGSFFARPTNSLKAAASSVFACLR